MKTKVLYLMVFALFLVGSSRAQELQVKSDSKLYGRCEPGGPIHGESLGATDQVRIWWEEQQPNPGGQSGWLSYIPENVTSLGNLGLGRAFHWGSMFPAEMLQDYVGSSLVMVNFGCSGNALDFGNYKVRIFYGNAFAPNSNYLVAEKSFVVNSTVPQVMEIYLDDPVLIDGTKNIWVLFYQDGSVANPAPATYDVGEPNNRWIGDFSLGWFDMAGIAGAGNYSWILWAYVRGTNNNELLALPNNCQKKKELNNCNMSPKFDLNLNVAYRDVPIFVRAANNHNRDGIERFIVYRSTNGLNYELLGSVEAEEGQTMYEYYDSPAYAGTYYYRVKAEYYDGCLSNPAPSAENPDINYVVIGVDEVNENQTTVSLYPNPATNSLIVEALEMKYVLVMNVVGQLVYETEIIGEESCVLDISGFDSGVYMIRIITRNGIYNKKVSVLH